MKKSKEFKKLLLSNPDLKVEIVNGVDSICELCNNHPESNPERKLSSEFKCSEDDRSDQLSLYEYGLEIGKVYTMRQIIEKIEAFKERSGTRSPRAFRDRFFDPNKVMDYLKEYFKNEN